MHSVNLKSKEINTNILHRETSTTAKWFLIRLMLNPMYAPICNNVTSDFANADLKFSQPFDIKNVCTIIAWLSH